MPAPVRDRGGLGLIDWLDELYWAWRASRVVPGENYDLHETTDGSLLLLGANSQSGRLGRQLQFFQLVNATTYDSSGNPTYKIRVVRSTFGGAAPDFPSADAPFSDGDAPPCIFTVTSDGVLYGEADIDQSATDEKNVVTATNFAFSDKTPDDADDGSKKYVQIGSWHIDTDKKTLAVANDVYGPIAIQCCRQWFSADEDKHWKISFPTGGATE